MDWTQTLGMILGNCVGTLIGALLVCKFVLGPAIDRAVKNGFERVDHQSDKR